LREIIFPPEADPPLAEKGISPPPWSLSRTELALVLWLPHTPFSRALALEAATIQASEASTPP
jgi:hypothetical protein